MKSSLLPRHVIAPYIQTIEYLLRELLKKKAIYSYEKYEDEMPSKMRIGAQLVDVYFTITILVKKKKSEFFVHFSNSKYGRTDKHYCLISTKSGVKEAVRRIEHGLLYRRMKRRIELRKQSNPTIRIGNESEKKVRSILIKLRDEGLILNFLKSTTVEDELEKVDIWVTAYNGTRIPLQIKSSRASASKHMRKYPHIPVVVSGRKYSRTNITNQVLRVLSKFNDSSFANASA